MAGNDGAARPVPICGPIGHPFEYADHGQGLGLIIIADRQDVHAPAPDQVEIVCL